MRRLSFQIQDPDYTSLNKIYSSRHWSYRKKLADEWHELVGYSFLSQHQSGSFIPYTGKVRVEFIFRKKGREMDVDNFSLCCKFILDSLTECGVWEDDKVVVELRIRKEKSESNQIDVTICSAR